MAFRALVVNDSVAFLTACIYIDTDEASKIVCGGVLASRLVSLRIFNFALWRVGGDSRRANFVDQSTDIGLHVAEDDHEAILHRVRDTFLNALGHVFTGTNCVQTLHISNRFYTVSDGYAVTILKGLCGCGVRELALFSVDVTAGFGRDLRTSLATTIRYRC